MRQTESWEKLGKQVQQAKVFNPGQITLHPDHVKEQQNLEMVRDQFLTLKYHRNLNPEKDNTKLVENLEEKAFGLDDSRNNKLHMRNINEQLSLIEVENYHSLIAAQSSDHKIQNVSAYKKRPMTAKHTN